MLEKLKERVYRANMLLKEHSLVIFTWGNVSAVDREKGLVVIKPSGVEYEKLKPELMVVLDLSGNIIEGELNPSSDTETHIVLYRNFQISAAWCTPIQDMRQLSHRRDWRFPHMAQPMRITFMGRCPVPVR